jgi:hypothetical protein
MQLLNSAREVDGDGCTIHSLDNSSVNKMRISSVVATDKSVNG